MSDTNLVIEGAFKDFNVYATDEGYVFLGTYYSKNPTCYLDKTRVKSVQKLNEESSFYKEKVAFWLGSVAAAGASDVKDYVIEVEWVGGGTSLLKVRESMYTRILATSRVDVKEERRKKKEAEEAIAIQKKYDEACSCQKSNDFQKARELFNELRDYKDSRERLQQVENEINKILGDPDKPNKIQQLREAYKKYATITLILACLFPIVAALFFVFADAYFWKYDILYCGMQIIAIVLIVLTFVNILLHRAFKAYAKDEDLNDAYVSATTKGDTPASMFKVFTWFFAIISAIITTIIYIASY